jgi:hypothetical protein
MNETASLERGYRRVLAYYPKAFRQEPWFPGPGGPHVTTTSSGQP